MVNRKLVLSLFLLIVLNFMGCQENKVRIDETATVPKSTVAANPSLALTMEQKLQDFDYLYTILKENYPFFWVNQRVNGVDWLAKKDDYIQQIKETRTDGEFGNVLNAMLYDLHNGHTQLLVTRDYENYIKTYESLGSVYKPWVEALLKPTSQRRYNYTPSKQTDTPSSPVNTPGPRRYRSDTIIPGKVAYLKVSSFNKFSVESDREGILNFLNTIKDYPILIVDIRQNGGGSDAYWRQNIVAPLVEKDVTAEFYNLYRGGNYSEAFIKSRGIQPQKIETIGQQLLNTFPPETKREFKYATKINVTIKPSNYVGFKGKIYLLVDKRVFSSSESFAAFCKASRWATLVGERTGGDGMGTDPLLVSLPNSGYIVRFSWVMGVSPDGTCNEEKKTEPDIKVDPAIGSTYKEDKAIQEVLKLNNLANQLP